MSRIYQSVTSYLPFGRKSEASPPKPEEVSDKSAADQKENLKEVTGESLQNGNTKEKASPNSNTVNSEAAKVSGDESKENAVPELPSNKKTDEVYDPQAQPGLMWRAASGIYGTASSAVGMGVGGIKWVANTGVATTSAVVTTTTGVIKRVPQVIKRKDKKE